MGSIEIRCVSIPGHTPGAISYFIDMKDGGDSYRVGTDRGPGLNTLSDEYLARNELPYNRRKDYLDSLKKLQKEKVDIFLSIHPNQNNILEKAIKFRNTNKNPFINESDWNINLNNLEKEIREIL